MGLFKKLFGSADPLANLRRLAEQERWAEVLSLAEDLPGDHPEAAEIEGLRTRAGDALATLNLDEAEAFLRADEPQRAREHLRLAAGQTRNPDLLARLEALEPQPVPDPAPVPVPPPAVSDCGGSCSDHCRPPAEPEDHQEEAPDLDLEIRLELCLGGYPGELAERYQGHGEAFQQAVVLAHQGEASAEAAFAAIPDAERDALFFFERGTLLGRSGRLVESVKDLEQALDLAPPHPFAADTLVTMLFESDQLDQLEVLLDRLQQEGYPPASCLARRALLEARRQRLDAAQRYGEEAFAAGDREPELLLLLAGLAERAEDFDGAENYLVQLPGGGCGGGAAIPLAEFWLRRGRHLDKALEAFKGAWRGEPSSPLWPLRTAQVYLAQGWHQEGSRLLSQVLAMPDLPEALRREAQEADQSP